MRSAPSKSRPALPRTLCAALCARRVEIVERFHNWIVQNGQRWVDAVEIDPENLSCWATSLSNLTFLQKVDIETEVLIFLDYECTEEVAIFVWPLISLQSQLLKRDKLRADYLKFCSQLAGFSKLGFTDLKSENQIRIRFYNNPPLSIICIGLSACSALLDYAKYAKTTGRDPWEIASECSRASSSHNQSSLVLVSDCVKSEIKKQIGRRWHCLLQLCSKPRANPPSPCSDQQGQRRQWRQEENRDCCAAKGKLCIYLFGHSKVGVHG